MKPTTIAIVCLMMLAELAGCNSVPGVVSKNDDKTLPDSILSRIQKDALDRVRREAFGDGKDREHPLRIIGAWFAELNGKPPREAVLQVEYYIGEGCRDYFLVVYSLENPKTPRMILCKKTHDEYMDPGYCRIVDLDRNGQEEILVVGDTDGMIISDLHVYVLKEGILKDLVWGEDCGAAYFTIDADGDGKDDILALSVDEHADPQRVAVRILKMDNAGYYRETPLNRPAGDLMLQAFEQIVSAGRIYRAHDDFALLVRGIRESGKSPGQIAMLQPALEMEYSHLKPEYGCEAIVDAMRWPRNTAAAPFLRTLLASSDKEDARGAAADALATVQGDNAAEALAAALNGQLGFSHKEFDFGFVSHLVRAMLSLGNRQGLDTVIAKIKDPGAEKEMRHDLIFWVLGESQNEAANVLLDLAFHSTDSETRRLAAVRLENWPDFRPALKASDLIPGLKNPDPSVRASCAIALEKFDKREVSGPLIAALEKEEEKWPRRQMTLALLWLKTEAPESLCRWLLETETDPEIRELVRGLMKNSGYKFDRKDIEKGLADGKHPDDIGKWLDLAAKKQAKEFVPLIATLARRGEGNFVRTAATSALGNFNLPDSKKTLRELLATAADAAVRSRAANSLGKLKDIEAEDVLIKALRSDSDGGVRIAAAAALGSLGTMKAENALITGFQKEGETDYIDALVAVSSLRAREALAEKLARMESLGLAAGRKPGDYRILFALAHGLLEMNDMRGMEVMARWLEPRFPEELRVSVIEVLDDTKDALPLIRRYANDESRNVRTAVIRAISKGATGDGPIM